MTARRPALDERDPQPPREWVPTSSEWARRQCREALAAALRKKHARQQDEKEQRDE